MIHFGSFFSALVLWCMSALWIHRIYASARAGIPIYLDPRFISICILNIINLQLLISLRTRYFSIGEYNYVVEEQSILSIQIYLVLLLCIIMMFNLVFSANDDNKKAFYPALSINSTVSQWGYIFIILFNYILVGRFVVQYGIEGYFDLVGARFYRDPTVFLILTSTPFAMVACAMAISSIKSIKASLTYVALYMILAFFAGGRGGLVIGAILAIASFFYCGFRLRTRAVLIYFLLPMAFIFSIYTDSVRYRGSDVSMSAGGMLDAFTENETFASWKSVYVVFVDDFRLPYPGYGIISSITFPIPREMFISKPIPPSTLFTKYVSPIRFDETGSEIVLSGIGQYMAELGPTAGVVLFGVFIAFVCMLQMRFMASMHHRHVGILLFIYLMTCWRADVFTASRPLWIMVILTVLYWLVGSVLRLGRSTGARSRNYER